jgi:hypothetical protein
MNLDDVSELLAALGPPQTITDTLEMMSTRIEEVLSGFNTAMS